MLYRNPVGNEWKGTEAAHPVLSNYKVWFSAFLPALWFAFNLRERLFIFMHSCSLLCVLIGACRYNSIRHSVLVCLFFCILGDVYHQKKWGNQLKFKHHSGWLSEGEHPPPRTPHPHPHPRSNLAGRINSHRHHRPPSFPLCLCICCSLRGRCSYEERQQAGR